jgi:hypothetical protein
MTYLKLTRLHLTLQGELKEDMMYVNPQHIRVFSEHYADNFEDFVTAISWANPQYMEIYVKETPYQIEQQLTLC